MRKIANFKNQALECLCTLCRIIGSVSVHEICYGVSAYTERFYEGAQWSTCDVGIVAWGDWGVNLIYVKLVNKQILHSFVFRIYFATFLV